jgi:hypothetical protein
MLTPPVRVSLDDALLFKDPRTMSARQQIAYLEKIAVINDDDSLRTAALALGIRGVRDDRPAVPVTASTETAAEIAVDTALVGKKTKKKAKQPVACDGDAGGLCAVCATGPTALVPDSSVLLRCSECASLVHPACVRHPTDLIGSRRSDWRCRPCHQRAHESFLAAKSAQAAVLTTTTTTATAAAPTKRKRPAGAAAVRRKPAVKKVATLTNNNNNNNESMSSSSSDDDSDDDDHEDGEESSSSSSSSSASAASSSPAKAPTAAKTPPVATKRTPPKPTLKATTAVTPPKPKPIQILFSAPPVAQTPLARDRLFDATPAKSVIASNDRSPSAAAAAAVSAPPVAAATTPTPTVPPVNDPPRRKLQLKDPASLKRSAELHRSSGSVTTTGAAAAATTAAAASSATASTAPVAAVPSAQDVEFQQNMQRMLEKRAQSQRAVLDADFKVPLRKAQSDDPAASHRPVGAGPVAVVRLVPPPQPPPQPSLLSPPVKLKQAEGVGALWKVVPTPAVASPVLAQARVSAWDCFLAARAPLVANYLHLPVKSAQVLAVVQQQFIDLAPHEKQMYHAMADRRRQNVDAAIAEHDRFQAAFPEAFECPACALYITEDQFWQHYEWEVARKARHGQLARLADVGAPPRLWSPLTDN